jgi:SprT protein
MSLSGVSYLVRTRTKFAPAPKIVRTRTINFNKIKKSVDSFLRICFNLQMMYEQEIEDRLNSLEEIALSEWDYNRVAPRLTFDLRGEVGGRAYLQENRIQINPEALTKYKDHYIKQTIGHEYAHLVARDYFNWRIASHGVEWAKIMRSFGLPPDRCHTYNLTKARNVKKKYLYRCIKCNKEFNFTAIRHNRAMKGSQSYSHSTDNGKLVYIK